MFLFLFAWFAENKGNPKKQKNKRGKRFEREMVQINLESIQTVDSAVKSQKWIAYSADWPGTNKFRRVYWNILWGAYIARPRISCESYIFRVQRHLAGGRKSRCHGIISSTCLCVGQVGLGPIGGLGWLAGWLADWLVVSWVGVGCLSAVGWSRSSSREAGTRAPIFL